MYKFGKTSLERSEGVHPLLIECAERAMSYGIIDLTVPQYGGRRLKSDQKHLVDIGASQTMNSLHRVQDTGYGHAIDLIPLPVDWHNIEAFAVATSLMFRAAMEMGIIIEAGGHWASFKDWPHYQIPRGYL